MSMENNLKEFIEGLIHEVEKDLDETTATGNVAGYQTPNAFSDKGKSDKKRKKKIATQLGYSVVDGDVDNISEAIKGRNNKTGESFGMVIGSDKQGNNGYELKVRKMYNSRISSYGFIFDKDSNLTDIRDYGYSLDGKFPDMKGHASSTSVRPNKRETITQIAKITSPAFAKKIYQHVQKNNKMDESVNEASKLAMGIAGFTGTRGIAVDDFIQKHKIDAKKLFNFVKKGNLRDRMAFVSAIAGRPNNKMFKMITKQFGESVNERMNSKFYDARVQYIDPKSKKKFVGDVVRYDNGEYKVNLGKDGRFEKYILAKEKDLKIVSKSKKRTFESVNECWDTHKQVGMKMKGGKQVPNCVPKNEIKEDKNQIVQLKKKVGKSEIKFYDALSKIEKKLGKKNYRAFLEKGLSDFKINPRHYDYRSNGAAEEKLFNLAK